ncbi:FUN14 family-domain-containing protein [Pavlovales sp. CCMP2436]|nr:FUN14 family-domain-containing protein [Pavlovales sp. CCMP2436]
MGASELFNLFKGEYVTEFGVGAFAGYAAGFVLKRAAQVVIFTVGCLFVGMQVMANHGYVTVHWDRIELAWKSQFDTNHDGKIDSDDMNMQYEQVVKVLESGVPGAGGFTAGFLLGLRS